ncbi:hypothetical protein Bca52824_023132 [Brassica carinata]|uniref:Uncharacterized protein n=1 Tax=Brassica carinata TaxID=52824 RepID=A0A8X8ASM6_BRACI|nr:hypothetical protein Bca52824_023132 [Brassica carinata]
MIVVPESKIIKPPKARAKASKEALEMWTEVSRASGDIYAEPSARKSGHQSANNSTIMATGISGICLKCSFFHQQPTLTCR